MPQLKTDQSQNPAGLSRMTSRFFSSSSPAAPNVPSSNRRPIRVTPWGTRRGGENFGSGCFGSGAQSLRASETSTNPARSVSDGCPVKLRNGEHFVAQRWHQQQIHLGEDARHLLGNFAPEAVGLNKIHRREEAGLAEDVGPRVGHLHLELIDSAAQASVPRTPQRLRRRESGRASHRASRESTPQPEPCPAFCTVSSAARSTSVAGASFIQAGK